MPEMIGEANKVSRYVPSPSSVSHRSGNSQYTYSIFLRRMVPMLQSFKEKTIFVIFTVLLCSTVRLTAQEQPPAADSSVSANPIIKLDENRYQIGSLILDSKLRHITLKGKVNMQKGMIELLACAPGGKIHESVLVLDVVPYHLQVALLLLGLKYVGGVEYQGDPATPKGDSVTISVSWSSQGKDTTVRAEDLVWNIPKSTTMAHTPWIFVGSKTINGMYMADQEKSLITTYHDPFTIFDNPLSDGSNDELYQVNDRLVPPKGTPVTVIITAVH